MNGVSPLRFRSMDSDANEQGMPCISISLKKKGICGTISGSVKKGVLCF